MLLSKRTKLLVTSEGAFKYFHEHMICQQLIWEINTESQGTPDQMKAIIDQIRAKKYRFIRGNQCRLKKHGTGSKETGLKIYDKLFTDSIAKKENKEILTIR